MTSPAPRKPAQPAGTVPPPARPSPGVKGTPPLPVGKLMQRTGAGVARASLTDVERKMLAEAGIQWQPGMRLPANMAQILHQAREQLGVVLQHAHEDATVNLPLPVDPATPPLQVNTVPVEQLPPDKREYYQGVVQSMVRQELEREERAQANREEQARLARLPRGVQQAAAQATRGAVQPPPGQPRDPGQPRPSPTAPAPRSRLVRKEDLRLSPPEVVDDLGLYEQVAPQLEPAPQAKARPADPLRRQIAEQAEALQPGLAAQVTGVGAPRVSAPPLDTAAEPAPALPDADPPGEGEEAGKDETGGDQTQTHCPHCNFPLDQEDIPEPEYGDKMAFLHSVLGQKPYERSYPLLGGHVEVTFRTLTTQEMDDVFKQAYAERVSGTVNTMADFWERVNRMRLCLQLLTFKSDAFEHSLPDGLSRETNANAAKLWSDTSAVPEKLGPGESPLPGVEAWIFQNVLRTEHLTRMVTFACNQFNRLVAKLEALVDNSDFWRATGEQS